MSFFLDHINNFILGKNEETAVDERLFNAASFSFSLLSLIATGIKTFFDTTTLYTWASSIAVICIYALIFYFSRYKRENKTTLIVVFFLTTMYSLNSFYFLLGGSKGIVPISAVFCIVFLINISPKKLHGFMMCLMAVNISILHYLDYINPEWSNQFESEFARILDMAIFSISTILLTGFTVSYYKNSLNVEKEKIQRVNEELKQNAETLTLVNRKLEKAKIKAEESTKAKANFLSTMSHEIRNPLHAIIATSESLIEEKHLDNQQERLEILNFSSENLLRLINDILDYNKIEAGKMVISTTDFDLKKYAKDLVHSFSLKVNSDLVELSLDIDENIPHEVKGDKYRLGQVLINLVDNAIKFTKKGSVKLNISLISKKEKQCRILFRVEDTGIGIQKENQEKIFGIFIQEEMSTQKNYGGTGLGLAISKEIVKLLGGNLTVESKYQEGSSFSFSLDFSLPDFREQKETPEHFKKGLTRKKVMIVDDNEVNLRVIEMLVKKWEVDVIKCLSGKEALESITKVTPDIILMDVQMPEMDGFEATKEIKKHLSETPIIALTASNKKSIQTKTEECGMIDVLTKPFVPEELHQALLKHIK